MGFPIVQATLKVECEGDSDDPILIRNYVLALRNVAEFLENCGDAAYLESATITVYGAREGIAAQEEMTKDHAEIDWPPCPAPIVFHWRSGISAGFDDDWVLCTDHAEPPTWLDLRSHEGGW